MNQRTSALIIIASLTFFTTVGYAVDKNIKDLQAQLTEAYTKLKVLEEENRDLKKRLASKENEEAGYRLALENIENEIKALKDGE